MASLADPLDLPSGVRLPNRIAKAALHDGGAAIFAQLNHPGRQSNLLNIGHQPVAPRPCRSRRAEA